MINEHQRWQRICCTATEHLPNTLLTGWPIRFPYRHAYVRTHTLCIHQWDDDRIKKASSFTSSVSWRMAKARRFGGTEMSFYGIILVGREGLGNWANLVVSTFPVLSFLGSSKYPLRSRAEARPMRVARVSGRRSHVADWTKNAGDAQQNDVQLLHS